MNSITVAELKNLLDADPGLAIVDVRTSVEFAEAHIPQACNEPLDRLNPKALFDDGRLPKNRTIHLICRTGTRALKAAEKFAKYGFDRITVVEGGTLAWIEAGFLVSRGTIKTISLERQVRIAAGSLVLIGMLLGWFVHPGFLGLSAFVGVGLVFAGITDFCGMGLLLARLPWNRRKPD